MALDLLLHPWQVLGLQGAARQQRSNELAVALILLTQQVVPVWLGWVGCEGGWVGGCLVWSGVRVGEYAHSVHTRFS